VTVRDLVLVRQHRGSVKGVILATLEDETGFSNLVLWPGRFERFRCRHHDCPPARRRRHPAARGLRRSCHRRGLTDFTPALPRLYDHTDTMLEGRTSEDGQIEPPHLAVLLCQVHQTPVLPGEGRVD